MRIRVLFVASELTPIAKVGGLGDVAGSLPKALAQLSVDAKVIIPFYERIIKSKIKTKKLFDFKVGKEKAELHRTSSQGVEIFLVKNKKYLSTGPIYFEKTAFAGSKKEIDRFIFFSQAVFQLLMPINADSNADKRGYIRKNPRLDLRKSAIGWQPDVVHCNDWHTGALTKAIRNKKLKVEGKKLSTVYTIHNLANQGALGGTNWMAEGIKNADVVTTVSETYAKEIQTKKFGAGLEKLLKKRAKEGKLKGVLNGIDYDFWRPRKKNKLKFQNQYGLKKDSKVPLFGLVSRLTYQKGLRMLIPLIDGFVHQGAQFIFLGQGEEGVERDLQKAAKRHPSMVYTKIGFDAEFANQIYANSDFFLMPSRFEPSGLGQMIAMRYGTIPIVRATGGLKDSVRHLKTGFVFEKEKLEALGKAMELAVQYYNQPKKFRKIVENCKKQDFSWNKSAKKYKKLYQKLLKKIS